MCGRIGEVHWYRTLVLGGPEFLNNRTLLVQEPWWIGNPGPGQMSQSGKTVGGNLTTSVRPGSFGAGKVLVKAGMYIVQLPDEVLELDPGIDPHEGASVPYNTRGCFVRHLLLIEILTFHPNSTQIRLKFGKT